MKNKILNNYFSKIVFVVIVVSFCFLSSNKANAQFGSYGGRQLFYFGSEICNGTPSINVHFILNGDRIISLYDSPATQAKGQSNSDMDTSQVGQYVASKMTCMMIVGSTQIPIWVTDGIYYTLSGGVGINNINKAFTGVIDPFIKKINPNA